MNNLPSLSVRDAATFGRDAEAHGGAMPIITRYLSIARRRKWYIAGAIAVALLLGLVITLLMTPKYTAFATLEIQRETRNFTQVQGAQADEQSASIDQEFYETQYGLLRTSQQANAVVEALRLQDDPAFFERFGADTSELFLNGRPIGGNRTRTARVDAASDILLDHFNVSPERLSRLVRISFTSPDPVFSKRVVDAWSAQFVSVTLARRFEATAYARKFLEQRLGQLRTRIDQSERQLVAYAAQQGIVNLPATTPAQGGELSGERSLAADDLATLNRELSRAIAERIEAESRLGAVGNEQNSASSALPRLRERRAELAADYARTITQFKPDYPPAEAQRNQIAQIDRAIIAEEGRSRSVVRDTYDASVKRERELRAQVSTLKDNVLDTRRRSIQYNIFQRDTDTNRQLYDALLQRYKEIGVAGGVGVNNISVVDPAELPDKPSSPRLLLNMFVALLLGSAVGVGLAIAMEQIDEAIGDPSEVEELLETPLLGTIPVTDQQPVEALSDRKSDLSEAYLSLRTTLSFATDHGVPRVFAVTSTRAGEGKSTTSYALARSLARQNRRTLLIDADMRSPSVHHEMKVRNEVGLSNYLSGGVDAAAPLVRESDHDGLFFMSAGPQPPSAPELLSGERFLVLLNELKAQFDHIVLDAPPVMGLADAPLIASQIEGILFVIESHGTKKSMARVAIGRLRAANASILGVVLTKFDEKRAHYGYGYNYGASGYGYGNQSRDARS